MNLEAIARWSVYVGIFVLLAGMVTHSACAQSASVSGFVRAASDSESLQGVHVSLDNLKGDFFGAISNGDGFFAITRLPPGRYRLRASFVGFEAYIDTLEAAEGERYSLDIALKTDEAQMGELVVEAERESGAARVVAGMQTVTPEQIAAIPGPDISGDLVSYLSSMPGVVLMGDRGGQVFIRGGEPSHNMTLLDGMLVYQPFHILGFYSAFPAEIVSRADVHAGGFGSKFSGRISSVIDVQTRDGNKRAYSASTSLSPFTTSARIEGPLIRNRISFLGAARISLLDQLASHYVAAPLPYNFSDAFGKVHARISPGHQFSISGLNTHDRGSMPRQSDLIGSNDEIRWSNEAYGLRYLVAPGSLPILGEVLVSYSSLQSDLGPPDDPIRSSSIETVNTAFNVTNFLGQTRWDWGGFLRESTINAELGGLFQNVVSVPDRSVHVGGYLEPDVYLGYGLRVRPGISGQVYGTSGVFFEPRLRILLDRGRHYWSAAAGLYRQDISGLSDRRDATNIFTAWVETPFGEASKAAHALLGYRTMPFPWLEFSVEGFYKQLDDLFIGEWTSFPSFTTNLQRAHGRAIGFDLRLEVQRARFYGFVNYGFSSTRYEIQPESEQTANPGPFRPPHDRRHQINMLATGTLYGFDLNIRWQFGSGLPYSQIHGFDGFILMDGAVEVDKVIGFPRVIYESTPYRGVLPTYHRLDVTVDRTYSPRKGIDVTVQVGVLNAYDRRNLFALDLFTAQRTDQLPVVPIAGIKLDLGG